MTQVYDENMDASCTLSIRPQLSVSLSHHQRRAVFEALHFLEQQGVLTYQLYNFASQENAHESARSC